MIWDLFWVMINVSGNLLRRYIVWLGLVWNTEVNKISVSNARIQKLKVNIQNILEGYTSGFKWFEVSSIASVVGQIISTQAVFGDTVRLRTRYLYYCILVRSGWNSYIMLSQESVDELQFWVNNLESMNEKGTHLRQITDVEIQQIALFCDASDSDYGGHLT